MFLHVFRFFSTFDRALSVYGYVYIYIQIYLYLYMFIILRPVP